MASTFKSNDSLSSTDEIETNPKLSNDKSESDVVTKVPNCLHLNQAHLNTFTFAQLSTACVCFTEQIFQVVKLNAGCEIECIQTPLLASLKKNLVLSSHPFFPFKDEHRQDLYYLFFSTHAFDHAQYNVSLKRNLCKI